MWKREKVFGEKNGRKSSEDFHGHLQMDEKWRDCLNFKVYAVKITREKAARKNYNTQTIHLHLAHKRSLNLGNFHLFVRLQDFFF